LISGYNNLLAECKTRRVPVTPLCAQQIEISRAPSARWFGGRASGATRVFVVRYTLGPFIPPTNDRRLLPAAVTQLNAKIRLSSCRGRHRRRHLSAFPRTRGQYSGPDGLHILPSGNQAIANAFFTAIKAAIPQTPAFASR
jgi:hypothetical protein